MAGRELRWSRRVRGADFSALGSGALLIVASVEYRDGSDSESSERSSCSEDWVTINSVQIRYVASGLTLVSSILSTVISLSFS